MQIHSKIQGLCVCAEKNLHTSLKGRNGPFERASHVLMNIGILYARFSLQYINFGYIGDVVGDLKCAAIRFSLLCLLYFEQVREDQITLWVRFSSSTRNFALFTV